MSIRTILACMSGGTASHGTIELACQLANRFRAQLEAFHVQPDPRDVLMYGGGYGMPLAGEWIEQLRADAEDVVKATRTDFYTAIARHGVAISETPLQDGASATWRAEMGFGPMLVSRRARFFDLAVLGRSERMVDAPYTDTVEETLIHSGRPVLLAPSLAPAALGDSVAFGWNGSPSAVRALVAALPFLATARASFVMTVGSGHEESAAAVVDYLQRRGIFARSRHIPQVPGVGPGEQLLAAARDEGADLLAIGAYGHARWREILFGGATRAIVGTSRLPILLSH